MPIEDGIEAGATRGLAALEHRVRVLALYRARLDGVRHSLGHAETDRVAPLVFARAEAHPSSAGAVSAGANRVSKALANSAEVKPRCFGLPYRSLFSDFANFHDHAHLHSLATQGPRAVALTQTSTNDG